ncbi:hypothetical protein [Photobacterium ganghwense]|uniref:hypothetical protein n=1 Tax=Photobacterium ganghwense TaxID=320778 RepID=UPI0040562F34
MSNFYQGLEPGRRRRSSLRRPRRALTDLTSALSHPESGAASVGYVSGSECTAMTPHPALAPLSPTQG